MPRRILHEGSEGATLHSVTKSAIAARGSRRTTIISAAQRLAVSCGYTGFTVEDLAEAVGCSRRTLFNHVSSKEEAVLGVLPEVTDEQVEVLRGGGPTGHLVEDLLTTIVDSLGGDDGTVEDWQGLHDVILRNPELLARVQEYVDELSSELVTHLVHREGVDADVAWMGLTVVAGVVSRSVRDCIDDPARGPLPTRVRHNLGLTREVLADRR